MHNDWTVIANYASSTEADMYIEILKEAGIPAVIRADVGIFGAGFSGATARGASIAVPGEFADRARGMIGDETEAEEPI